MKNFVFILFAVLSAACSPDTFTDCVGKEGRLTVKQYEVDDFLNLYIDEGVTVQLVQDTVAYLDVKAGEHIIPNFDFYTQSDTLFIKNKLSCSLGYTKPITVDVHFKNLNKIYSKTQFKVASEAYLNLDHLEIHQGLYGNNASGDFDLKINCNTLLLNFNTNSYFKLIGRVNYFGVYNWGGGTRIEADALVCDKIEVLHRGYNHFYLHATDEIFGNIYGIGNVYLTGNPAIKNVTTHYSGRLIE